MQIKYAKNTLLIAIGALLLSTTASSCKARRSSCDCPNNVNQKYKAPKAHKRNVYRK